MVRRSRTKHSSRCLPRFATSRRSSMRRPVTSAPRPCRPRPYNAGLDMSESRPDYTPFVPPGGIDHRYADMTAFFAAAVTLKQAQATLGERDQWLPIDGDEELTLGQLVEQNSTG